MASVTFLKHATWPSVWPVHVKVERHRAIEGKRERREDQRRPDRAPKRSCQPELSTRAANQIQLAVTLASSASSETSTIESKKNTIGMPLLISWFCCLTINGTWEGVTPVLELLSWRCQAGDRLECRRLVSYLGDLASELPSIHLYPRSGIGEGVDTLGANCRCN